MKQTDWKIIYTAYQGVLQKAVNLISREVGALLIREEGVYRLHVLPCEREGAEYPKNACFIGRYEDSPTMQRYIAPDEVPQNGYLIKVIQNPNNAEGRLVFLTARTDCEVFYAAVGFLDDYIPAHAPTHGSNRMPDLLFDRPLPEATLTECPQHQTRSIFTWGHSINDYRAYIDNMARQKWNEWILWNDYIPLNIHEIIAYAHAYGIKVVLGYSWGWQEIGRGSKRISRESIAHIKELVIRQYRDQYAAIPCDGIYFQSFTEQDDDYLDGRLIADVVTDMVNEIAVELWRVTPSLRLIFGLHATSVCKHLEQIARVDPRIEILWEDCGEFPYAYRSFVADETDYRNTLDFTKRLLKLRDGVGVGLVFKGVMMLDWEKFVNQTGAYVMGENAASVADHDRRIRASAWREYSADWIRSGARVAETLAFIQAHRRGEVNLCLAGTFDGGIYLPQALCAQMFRCMDADYPTILSRVLRRPCVTLN